MTDPRPVVWWARGLLPGAVAVLVGVTGFLAVLDGVRENEDLARLDDPVLHALVLARGPALTATMRTISLVTGPTVLPILVAVAALVWGLRRREWWRPLLLVGAMIGSTLLGLTLKGLVDRPRPPVATMDVPGLETTASFPSGHTLGTATLLLVAGYLSVRARPTRARVLGWAGAAVVGTSAVALSRLYLGYHFLTDVVAAIALAVAVLGVVMLVDARHVAASVAAASGGAADGGRPSPGGHGPR